MAKAYNFEYVKCFIESKGCKLISNEYINSKIKLEVRFECGHMGEISFDCFNKGVRCSNKNCLGEKIRLGKILSIEEIKNRLSKKKLEIINFPNGYISRKSLIACKCPNDHYETRTLSACLKGSKGCTICDDILQGSLQRGEGGNNWQGGKCGLVPFLKNRIKKWKNESLKASNYQCVLCHKDAKIKDIHHLYSFVSIVKDALKELNLNRRKYVYNYYEEEILLIESKVLEIHYRYPLGIVLCRAHHLLFHINFGQQNNTPQQFEEFKQRIKSGELNLPEHQ